MTTQTFSPLSVAFAADAEGTMTAALDAAEEAAGHLVRAKADKREAEGRVKDREAELTLASLMAPGDTKTTADVRKAQTEAAQRADGRLQGYRRDLADALNRIDQWEAASEVALKRWWAAKSVMDYATATINLYANGRSLL